MTAEKLQLLDHLVRLSRLATSADYVELVVGEDFVVRISDGVAPLGEQLGDESTLLWGPTAGPASLIADISGSFALLPVTGAAAEPGSLIAYSREPGKLDEQTLAQLESSVVLIERHLDQAVERIRLDQISDVLRANHSELRAAQARLEMSNTELEQFAYIAAHELLAPLRSVAVYAEVLEMNTGNLEQEQLHSCTREIREGVASMDRQMRNLLELSSTQQKAVALAPVNLNETVQRSIESVHDLLEEADATVDVGELPVVAGQPILFQSVFVNLISNAVKYRNPNQPVEITIDAERTARGSEIRVADNGPGVEPEHQERIFGLFERASTSTAGSGIGLGLSRRILEAFGGEISYQKSEAGGSCFSLFFPTPETQH